MAYLFWVFATFTANTSFRNSSYLRHYAGSEKRDDVLVLQQLHHRQLPVQVFIVCNGRPFLQALQHHVRGPQFTSQASDVCRQVGCVA